MADTDNPFPVEVFVHPRRAGSKAQWTWTAVYESGESTTSDMINEPDAGEQRAFEVAAKTSASLWKVDPNTIKVLDEPYKIVKNMPATPEAAAARTAARKDAATKAAATKAVKKAGRVEAQRLADEAEAAREKANQTAIAKLATKGFDPAKHYGHQCAIEGCDAFVERTGKRGRPPANCAAHRDVVAVKASKSAPATSKPKVAAMDKPQPFGPKCYADPCVNCGKGITKSGQRGRPPKHCQRKACQKVKAKALAAKVAA